MLPMDFDEFRPRQQLSCQSICDKLIKSISHILSFLAAIRLDW